MTANSMVLGLVGSPNREGKTFEIVNAALMGAADTGANIQLIHIADHVPMACKDCQSFQCAQNQQCQYEDEAFEYLTYRLRRCDGLIMGTPVYWGDATSMVRNFIIKCMRVLGMSAPMNGLPAVGIAVAGGSGFGLTSGLRPMYHLFQVMRMRALDPLPATKFNWKAALQRAEALGDQIASLSDTRRPFSSMDDSLQWYDKFTTLRLTPSEEKRMLAGLAVDAAPAEVVGALKQTLVDADALETAGEHSAAMKKVAEAYNSAAEAMGYMQFIK